MDESGMEHIELVLMGKDTLCVDGGEQIAAGEWAAPRLDGITPEGTDISEMICMKCILLGAQFAVLSIRRPEED